MQGGTGAVVLIIDLAFTALMAVSMWIIFTKAGEPRWAAFIPFYNIIVFLKVAGKPLW